MGAWGLRLQQPGVRDEGGLSRVRRAACCAGAREGGISFLCGTKSESLSGLLWLGEEDTLVPGLWDTRQNCINDSFNQSLLAAFRLSTWGYTLVESIP